MQRETAVDAPWRTMRPFDDSGFLDLLATRRGAGCSRAKEKARDGRLAEMGTRNMISGEKKHQGHD